MTTDTAFITALGLFICTVIVPGLIQAAIGLYNQTTMPERMRARRRRAAWFRSVEAPKVEVWNAG
jgi:hypothetical protein